MKTYVFPGQGSQVKGMGESLFDNFKDLTKNANDILGFSIKQLCLKDSEKRLNLTQYTQPALYVVNSLSYLKHIEKTHTPPDFLMGHSLGEYNALFAAGAVDFEIGLTLVKKRGELMSKAEGGCMAAVLGLSDEKITQILIDNNFSTIDIANFNTPSQIVISGPKKDIEQAQPIFKKAGAHYIQLSVSAAFHSRYMQAAKDEFETYLKQFEFGKLNIPVISNVHARPYRQNQIITNLADQLRFSVKWTESVRYLMGKGDMEFVELGHGTVLTKMIKNIQKEAQPLVVKDEIESINLKTVNPDKTEPAARNLYGDIKYRPITATSLGSDVFKRTYNLKYAYVTGAMVRGIASKELVIKMGKAGMMGFFGAGGLSVNEVESAIVDIKRELKEGQPFGINLLHSPLENEIVDLLLKHNVRIAEAAAYLQITHALVKYRLKGLHIGPYGSVVAVNRIMAKISRPEVAAGFLSPAPQKIVDKLFSENLVTKEEAELSQKIPMADELCVEADSGGHTDGGVAYTLMPAILSLRDEMKREHKYPHTPLIGAAGGIGTPEAAAAAFILGADFILTGSINQCTVEAGVSDAVKDLLQDINVQDTEYAPAGDMFEMGAKVQVLKRGVFFPARANKLYELYRHYNSIDEIDDKTKKQIQKLYFKRTFEDIYKECKTYWPKDVIEKAERNPKHKMALIFRWYFGYSNQLALNGVIENKVDFQIHCGPSLGAFNQWVKNTDLQNWHNRHVDQIADMLMKETAILLNKRFQAFLEKVNPN